MRKKTRAIIIPPGVVTLAQASVVGEGFMGVNFLEDFANVGNKGKRTKFPGVLGTLAPDARPKEILGSPGYRFPSRGRGWFYEPYRHSLAARGCRISGERKSLIPVRSSNFSTIRPVHGEVNALRELIDMMNVSDRRKYIHQVPMMPGEAGSVTDMIRIFRRRVRREEIDDHLLFAYDYIDKKIQEYRNTGDTKHLLIAVDSAIYLLHNSPAALLSFVGRSIEDERDDENQLAWYVMNEALNLQRGELDVEVGEGQDLLKWWMKELNRRRLT